MTSFVILSCGLFPVWKEKKSFTIAQHSWVKYSCHLNPEVEKRVYLFVCFALVLSRNMAFECRGCGSRASLGDKPGFDAVFFVVTSFCLSPPFPLPVRPPLQREGQCPHTVIGTWDKGWEAVGCTDKDIVLLSWNNNFYCDRLPRGNGWKTRISLAVY